METAQTKRETDDTRAFVGAVAFVLRETFEGPPIGQPSAYLDKNAGFLETVANLSGVQASREFHGTTIAAQTEHAKFYLDRLCEYINGRTDAVNWEDSWLIETVNDEEWAALQASVKQAYENTLRCLASVEDWNEMRAGMAMGIVAHTAYHLGAVRQISKIVHDN